MGAYQRYPPCARGEAGADRKCQRRNLTQRGRIGIPKHFLRQCPQDGASWSTPAPPAGGRISPGVCTRTSRGAAARSGAHRSTGWGGAALLVRVLDTRRKMEEGRTRRRRRGEECSGNADRRRGHGGPDAAPPQPSGRRAATEAARTARTALPSVILFREEIISEILSISLIAF